MKEFYIAPEAEIICFAPVEELATADWDFSGNDISLMNSNGGNGTVEIEIPETTNPDSDGEMNP